MVINIYYPWYLKLPDNKVAVICSHVSGALIMKYSEGGCDTIYYNPDLMVVNVQKVSLPKFREVIEKSESDEYSCSCAYIEDNKDIAFGIIE